MKWLLATVLLLIPATSHGFTATFTNQILFESQLQASVVDDYENPGYTTFNSNLVMGVVLNETKYTTTGWTELNLVTGFPGNKYYCAGCNGSCRLDFTDTSLTHNNGVDAVGFTSYNEGSLPYVAFIQFGDGSTANYFFDPVPYSPSFTSFFGIISDKQIATMHLGLVDGGGTTSGSFGQDNLTIGRVPEPSSLCLCVGSIVLLRTRRLGQLAK